MDQTQRAKGMIRAIYRMFKTMYTVHIHDFMTMKFVDHLVDSLASPVVSGSQSSRS